MKAARSILENRASVSSRDEDAFFAKLRLPNGTFKTTGAGRLAALDQWLATQLGSRDVRLLDVAVSSGVTTVDLIDALTAHGINATVTACDLCISAYIRSLAPGIEALFDANGHVLQLSTPVLVKGRPHDPRGSFARSALAASFRVLERLNGLGQPRRRSGDRPVQLISRRLQEQGDVEVVEHDLFALRAEWAGRFDIIRAANILNRDYFDNAQLTDVLRSLSAYLAPGGMLLVARTDETSVTTATLFRRDADGRFALVDRYGGGSYIEHLVLAAHDGARAGVA